MADVLTPEQRRRCMSRVRSRDTKPEVAVRRALHAAGFRFRLHKKDLPGKPDIVLAKYGTAVFVNGCYWHGHDCRYAKLPETNRKFWAEKIESNVMRDRDNAASLREQGWDVAVIWTCDLERGVASLLDGLSSKRVA